LETKNSVVDPKKRREFLEKMVTDPLLRSFYEQNKELLDCDEKHEFSPLDRTLILSAKVILDDIFSTLMNMTPEERKAELTEGSSIYNKYKMFMKVVMDLGDRAKVVEVQDNRNENPLMNLTRLEGETEGETFKYEKRKKEEPIDVDLESE